MERLTESGCGSAWVRLTGVYTRTLLWYALGVAVLWVLGVEAIYGSPTPFYALLFPAFAPNLGHLLSLAVLLFFIAGITLALAKPDWFDREPSRRYAAWFVTGLVVFLIAFSMAIAMIRNGPAGIAQAYARHGYEYISDIGVARGIKGLFHDYAKLRPYLSMHAKVHPPGPIALLWLLSYVVGQEPMALSIATVAVGALGLVPLYLWAADLAGRRAALTCCMMYAVMPSVVLFTATSADILFTPFTLTTLFLFWRALHRRSAAYAVAAGCGYAVMSLISFSLLSLGAFFGFVGLWRFLEPKWRGAVVRTAVLMVVSFLLVHVAVWWWSGFDMIGCYRACKAQFGIDQVNLDMVTPRFPSWTWKILNPMCWFYYAGIPVSVLFVWQIWAARVHSAVHRPGSSPGSSPGSFDYDYEHEHEHEQEGPSPRPQPLNSRMPKPETPSRGLFIVCALTLAVLDLVYLGRGEGERSAMYIFPFVALPAACWIDQAGRATRSRGPLLATLAFLAFQCWLTESCLYTFW